MKREYGKYIRLENVIGGLLMISPAFPVISLSCLLMVSVWILYRETKNPRKTGGRRPYQGSRMPFKKEGAHFEEDDVPLLCYDPDVKSSIENGYLSG